MPGLNMTEVYRGNNHHLREERVLRIAHERGPAEYGRWLVAGSLSAQETFCPTAALAVFNESAGRSLHYYPFFDREVKTPEQCFQEAGRLASAHNQQDIRLLTWHNQAASSGYLYPNWPLAVLVFGQTYPQTGEATVLLSPLANPLQPLIEIATLAQQLKFVC